MGPAQLLTRVKNPTAKKLYPLMPLYALERSTEEMAFEPPKAKKEACCSRMVVVVISGMERSVDCRKRKMTSESRKMGILVARDCVMPKIVYRWWRRYAVIQR